MPTPEPATGEVLVRTDYLGLSVAYLEMLRADSRLPIPPWEVGQRIGGGAVGTVVRSISADLAVGDQVRTMAGWCEYSAGSADQYPKLDPDLFPSPVHYLSQGPTAYYGMSEIAKAGAGDVVFVSGAAGGVGSLAGQIAKCRGAAKVIGSAGSQAKIDYLVDELGFDAAFDYHDGPVLDHLRELAPEGITVFFDNVGKEQFDAAVEAAAPGPASRCAARWPPRSATTRTGSPSRTSPRRPPRGSRPCRSPLITPRSRSRRGPSTSAPG